MTSYPVTSPGPYALGTTTISYPSPTGQRPVPSYTCEEKYTIQKSDTCINLSWTKKVFTFALLSDNSLPALCAGFPAAGTEICIPQQCNIYIVSPVDTCARVVKAKGLTVAQLIEYNPNLNSRCSDLRDLAGYVIC